MKFTILYNINTLGVNEALFQVRFRLLNLLSFSGVQKERKSSLVKRNVRLKPEGWLNCLDCRRTACLKPGMDEGFAKTYI